MKRNPKERFFLEKENDHRWKHVKEQERMKNTEKDTYVGNYK